jgi:hypothetical protein
MNRFPHKRKRDLTNSVFLLDLLRNGRESDGLRKKYEMKSDGKQTRQLGYLDIRSKE